MILLKDMAISSPFTVAAPVAVDHGAQELFLEV